MSVKINENTCVIKPLTDRQKVEIMRQMGDANIRGIFQIGDLDNPVAITTVGNAMHVTQALNKFFDLEAELKALQEKMAEQAKVEPEQKFAVGDTVCLKVAYGSELDRKRGNRWVQTWEHGKVIGVRNGTDAKHSSVNVKFMQVNAVGDSDVFVLTVYSSNLIMVRRVDGSVPDAKPAQEAKPEPPFKRGDVVALKENVSLSGVPLPKGTQGVVTTSGNNLVKVKFLIHDTLLGRDEFYLNDAIMEPDEFELVRRADGSMPDSA